ncbi:hypothetical protein QUB05_13980 [Microcoleus sp. F10-C6]|uniref:hypothetical protein n=1 Tax=unclassified Microcoleus TaxID=2642155 RepID=UPI002FD0F03A
MTSGASTKNPVSIAVFDSATDDFCLFRVFWSIVLNKLKFLCSQAVPPRLPLEDSTGEIVIVKLRSILNDKLAESSSIPTYFRQNINYAPECKYCNISVGDFTSDRVPDRLLLCQ